MKALTKVGGSHLFGIPEARFRNALGVRKVDVRGKETTDGRRRAGCHRACGTGAHAGRGGRAVGVFRRHFRHRRRCDPGAGVLRMLPARRRAAGSADATLHRHFIGHHHSNLDPLVSCPSRPRRGRSGNPQIVVAADRHRRHRRQRHRALCAGAAVQDRVRRRGVVGRSPALAGARQLETRRRPPAGAADAALRLHRRTAVDADGGRRRPVLEPADDVLRPPHPSGGCDLVGARGADLDPGCARLHLCRLACRCALSGCHRAAMAVRDRLRLADRCVAGDADQPSDRAARRACRACDVEAHAGGRVRLLSLYRRQPERGV